MRCPKCHYISFESADRCRNCGYEFSLSTVVPQSEAAELPLHDRNEHPSAPVDLSLSQVEGLNDPREQAASAPFDVDRVGASTPFDLPLFKGHAGTAGSDRSAAQRRMAQPEPDDAPLIRPSAVPRPPIAVRRATPDAQRLRSRYSVAEVPRLDLEPDTAEAVEEVAPAHHERVAVDPFPAPPVRRLFAAVVDLSILGGIGLGVLYFTLKLSDLPLTARGVSTLPAVPLVGFLLLLAAGYSVTFTAVVGQTIGKMAAGLRVVHVSEQGEDEERPSFGFAILRTAAYAASILPIGLGFLPAFLGRDRRALHDRLAETRVIAL
jgi:uncharacterized RDD family membrane protein YckC